MASVSTVAPSDAATLLLVAILVPSGVALALATWLFRRKSQVQRRELRHMYAAAESMISANDPGEIYRQIVNTLPPILQATHGYLWLLNRVTRQLDVLASTDKQPMRSIPLDSMAGQVTCLKNKAMLDVPDAEHCPFVDRATVERLQQKSQLFVPLVSEGEAFGVLQIDDRQHKRTFSEEQKACAQHVANLGALAMRVCEQRSMREQLYRTEKMAAVGELITGVAHELKNPLATMTGLAELAMARTNNGAAPELRALHEEAQHATTILQRLISFARPQKSGPKLVDLNTSIRTVVNMRAQKLADRGITVRLLLSPTAPTVLNDPAHLEQVFLNLLIHAEGAMEGAREKTITIKTIIMSKRAVVEITNTGQDMYPEIQGRRFDSGLDGRRLDETAGLGLAVCQSLIEGHGGSIQVHGGPRQGTTFEIEYPLAASLPEPEPGPIPAESPRMPGDLTALVIDADTKVQDSLLNLLSDRNYRVITVSSAEEALDLVERLPFDLILCDVRLRGMSGIELYRRIKNRIQAFVFLTSDSFSADLRDLFSERNQAVLAKPFTPADVESLLEEIEPRLLDEHAGRTPSR